MTFLHAFIAILGAREIHRHNTALAGIARTGERHTYERWGRQWARVWGLGAVLIGIGGLYEPLSSLGWIVAGTALILAIPTPCGWELINQHRVLKLLRNLFFMCLGVAFIGHGLGQW